MFLVAEKEMRLFNKKTRPAPTSVGTSNDAVRAGWVESQLAMLAPGLRILDAGAGEQRFKIACEHLEYVSQDFGEYESEENNKGLHVEDWDYGKLDHVCDIINIPEEDNSFDAILCTEVIEHIPYPHLAIEEFSRLLRPGGTLLLSAPFLSLTHFAPYHFSTGFNRYYYETLLPKAGFEVNDISCNGNFFELVAQEVRRVSSVADRYASSQVTPKEFSAMQQVLQMLERFSGEDSGSEELACFGLHVIATRQETIPAAKDTSAIENAVS